MSRYAVALCSGGRLSRIAARYLSWLEAREWLRHYHTIDPQRVAVVLRHPISAAIRAASAKSRSA